MSNEIVQFDVKALALPEAETQKYLNLAKLMGGEKDGLEGDLTGTWRPASLKIVQPVTQDPAKPSTAKNGDFFTKGGLVDRPLKGVVVYGWYSRVRFAGGDSKPSCGSENVDIRGRGKEDKSVSLYGNSCASCPYGDQPFTAGKRTSCNNVINVIVIPENLENIYQVQFSKSSYSTGQQLLGLLNATNPIWKRFYQFSSEVKKRDGGGVYHVMSVSPVDLQASEPAEHLKAFAQHVSEQVKAQREIDRTRVRKTVDQVASAGMTKAAMTTKMDIDSPKAGYKDTL
jgi:hypothetical protein